MEPNEKTIRHVLEKLADGVTCDYASVQGGVVMILDKSKSEGVDITTFLSLRNQGLISKQRTRHNWHPIFRPSYCNPIDIYGITDAGRDYLAKKS